MLIGGGKHGSGGNGLPVGGALVLRQPGDQRLGKGENNRLLLHRLLQRPEEEPLHTPRQVLQGVRLPSPGMKNI